MSKRDHNQLKVFGLADGLVVRVYELTHDMPVEERFALQSQVRRAAVSVAANIVEGCSRPTSADFVHFLRIVDGSAQEARYLIGLAARLGFVNPAGAEEVGTRYGEFLNALNALIRSQT